jgi:hypothetical protein
MDLNTRRHTRTKLETPVRFAVQLNHRAQVDLVGADANLIAHAREISQGGMSFFARVFLPRGTLLDLELEHLSGLPRDASSNQGVQLSGRVARSAMVGRQPRYLVSVAFTDLTPVTREKVSRYVAKSAGKAPATAGSRA